MLYLKAINQAKARCETRKKKERIQAAIIKKKDLKMLLVLLLVELLLNTPLLSLHILSTYLDSIFLGIDLFFNLT